MRSFTDWARDFEAEMNRRMPFPVEPRTLYDPGRYFLNLGGKRIRPVLCLMGCSLFAEVDEEAWRAAMAIELFHNFTLIHDDVMDQAPLRRGQVTVHERYGLPTAMLCGDVMNIFAFEQISGLGESLAPVLRLFVQTAREVCDGQQMDMDFETREVVSLAEYEEMIRLKTAVLLGASLQIGALIGGASLGAAVKLYEFGQALGLAFQIKDDYLDAFGQGQEVGKQTGGDIRANKKTFLWIQAMEKANSEQKKRMAQALDAEEETKVAEITQIFLETGAAEACQQRMEAYSQQAFLCLEEVPVQERRKEPLRELTAYLLHRNG